MSKLISGLNIRSRQNDTCSSNVIWVLDCLSSRALALASRSPIFRPLWVRNRWAWFILPPVYFVFGAKTSRLQDQDRPGATRFENRKRFEKSKQHFSFQVFYIWRKRNLLCCVAWYGREPSLGSLLVFLSALLDWLTSYSSKICKLVTFCHTIGIHIRWLTAMGTGDGPQRKAFCV